MNYWLVKQEPEKYSFDDLLAEGKTDWTGVRNFQARNNLRDMKKGDKVLFYHSTTEKAVVGETKVSRPAFPDPTDEKWIAVEITPVRKLKTPVPLQIIKSEPALAGIKLIKQSQLSVMPLTPEEFETITRLGK
jgi:predicted RNA-binding protein with PUA-like domain